MKQRTYKKKGVRMNFGDRMVMRKFILTPFSLIVMGCVTTEEFQEVQRQAGECRLDIEALREAQIDERADCAMLRAERDELERENQRIGRGLAACRANEQNLQRKLKAAQLEVRQTRLDVGSRSKELERAAAALEQSRNKWEQTLADRQKRIDILTNQVERLTTQRTKANSSKNPSTQPN